MNSILILNATIVNEGTVYEGDVLIRGDRIETIGKDLQHKNAQKVIDAGGLLLLPGVIDDQVHFREPGLTHKEDIYHGSRAAVAGGITSFMEMPNTVPNAVTQELLQQKYDIAAQKSLANYSFYMGATNDNIEEVLKTDKSKVCGVKVFMGSSTGNMLVDDPVTLENIFSKVDMLIATHCEDEATIRENSRIFKEKYGDDVPIEMHPQIRNREACYLSSSMAVELARKHGARLHVLHLSTKDELALFDNTIPLKDKHITAEVCVHHLWFDDSDYMEKGSLIKWNPAVKTAADREALLEGLLDDKLDVVATDHAPHTLEEKQNTYFKVPSGGPLVQHSLTAMMEFYKTGKISLEKIVEKMSHNPAILFGVEGRGFIREGYFADLVLIDPESPWAVDKGNILYKCGWSPFEGETFSLRVTHTIVSGRLAYEEGTVFENGRGARLTFRR